MTRGAVEVLTLTRPPGLAPRFIAIGLAAFTVAGGLGYQALARLASKSARPPAPSVLVVELTGDKGTWHVRYPGPDGRLDTPDDLIGGHDLHLPARTQVRLELRSRDAVYFFGVPGLGLNEAAVPDLAFALDFGTGEPGTFELRQDQICGRSHPDLKGRLVVEPLSTFADWLEQLAEVRPAVQSGR
jgi:cytochrome c oxidase subunit 2